MVGLQTKRCRDGGKTCAVLQLFFPLKNSFFLIKAFYLHANLEVRSDFIKFFVFFHFKNEEFPGPRTTGSSSLSWTIDRVSDDICFIRLDFVTLVVENADLLPGTGGACDVDTVTFT